MKSEFPMRNLAASGRMVIRLADSQDREEIYRLRHDVYARELGQHTPNACGSLRDGLDDFNVYIVALLNGVPAGFISITPPGHGRYSVDKYIRRDEFPDLFGDRLYEIRLLTVTKRFRGRETACALMYAAFRWVEFQGGEQIVAIGRREILDLYLHVGLECLGRELHSGAVTYDLMSATITQLHARQKNFAPLISRLERSLDWRLDVPFRKLAACFHGGAFFEAIGPEFDCLHRRHHIINADVLDAWFPPSPKVIGALRDELPWLLRTSPPTNCEGMRRVIARVRDVPEDCIVPSAGSSDAIFLAFRHWLNPSSRVLILDPTYGEYAHVLEKVIGCHVDRMFLSRDNNYRVDLEELEKLSQREYDLIALVNPNSPTGQHVPRVEMEKLMRRIPVTTRVWIDETYVEFANASGRDGFHTVPNSAGMNGDAVERVPTNLNSESLERFAAATQNVVVCKSMSKVYALSGVRAAYLCGPERIISELRGITPPWAVSLPAQVAAVEALQDPNYYAALYAETHRLRLRLAAQLALATDWEILPGIANFVLCHLPEEGPSAAKIVKRCREHGLFLRDVGSMGRSFGAHALRIAVKDLETNQRAMDILRRVLIGRHALAATPNELSPITV